MHQPFRFQSSPAVSSRCNTAEPVKRSAAVYSFNPHRLFPAGATPLSAPLTASGSGFNPHRLFPAGATACGMRLYRCEPLWFQSSPAVSSRCNRYAGSQTTPIRMFQSSPAVSSRCNMAARRPDSARRRKVSILTGCFQPVQRCGNHRHGRHRPCVSILTGCFQPVQRRMTEQTAAEMAVFQSSPAVSSRCNFWLTRRTSWP